MITTIYGTDTYRIREYLEQHAPLARYGEDALKYRGLFGETEPVVIFDPSPDIKVKDSGDINLFLVYRTAKKPTKKLGSLVLLNPLEGSEVRAWIKAYLSNLGLTAAPQALELLTTMYADTMQIKLELDKIASYKYLDGTPISVQDIQIICPVDTAQNIFAITDALANREKRSAFATLYQHLQDGVDPYYIFSMVVYQFRNVIKVKSGSTAGMHPFVARKTQTQAQRFSLDELKRIYRDLHQLEQDAKQGERDMADGLYEFAFSL